MNARRAKEYRRLAAIEQNKQLLDRRPNGTFDNRDMNKKCVCGLTLGEHDAAFPHPDNQTGGKLCAKFNSIKDTP